MRKLGFILAGALAFGVGVGGCRQDTATTEQPDPIERSQTPISLSVGTVQAPSSVAASRATNNLLGKVIEDPALLANEDLALYGVRQAFGPGTLSWDDRMISTTTARLEPKPNETDYRFNYGSTPAYYPEGGYLNVYALYPVDGAYVHLTDDNATAPSAQITLGTTFATQYDVLYGKTEKLTVAQAQQAQVTFQHALAQLRIKIYRDPNIAAAPKLTKVVVRGVRKATLASIERPTFTNSAEATDIVDFIAFNEDKTLSATTKESAMVLNAGSELMLFPGAGSIDKITITIDGNDFFSIVPPEWVLAQGKVNTLTLTLNQFGLRLETPWLVTPWGKGEEVNEGVENNGKIIQLSGRMVDASGATKVAYTGTAPETADITLLDYTHKGVKIESLANGVFTTEPFNSGSLNDNPLYLQGLSLYGAGGKTLFTGQLVDGKLQSGNVLYIDQTEKGLLRKDVESGATADLSMTFGGFGDGTLAVPYEVSLPVHLSRITQLLGKDPSRSLNGTSDGGAYFVQVNHIDLSGGSFAPIGTSSAFYGSYNGMGKEVRNLSINWTGAQHVGLFGWVVKAKDASNSGEVSNVMLASGSVVSTSAATSGCYVGSVVGFLGSGAKISRCASRAAVSAKATAGGVVGNAAKSTSITECAYLGSVSSDHTGNAYLGGVVGSTAGTLTDCYNRGSVRYTGSSVSAYVGGLAGYFAAASTTTNCYNQGRVESTPIGAANPPERTGALFGQVSSTSTFPAATGNLFALETAYQQPAGTLKLIGTDPSGAMTAKAASKTEAELKGLAPTLGGAWKADYATPINEGFPILTWQ